MLVIGVDGRLCNDPDFMTIEKIPCGSKTGLFPTPDDVRYLYAVQVIRNGRSFSLNIYDDPYDAEDVLDRYIAAKLRGEPVFQI